MRILAKPLGWVLMGLYNLVGNYGISLIILTLAVKLILYPLYAKQIKSTTKMSALQPKMQEIQQKYANDKATMNQKVSELYQKEGVSMTSGCMPMVIQMVIIMGLFALLRNPMSYMDSDNMLLAIHESFLWIQDLAQPDKWVLPIGAGVATFFSFNMSQANMGQSGNQQQMQMMTMSMKYFFPVMILLMARSYPAGLALYWFFSQIIQIFYNLRFNKIRKELKENATKKGKKKIVKSKA